MEIPESIKNAISAIKGAAGKVAGSVEDVAMETISRAKGVITERTIPGFDFRPIDFLKEIPSSTKKVIGGLMSFGKSVQEEIAKSGAAVGLTLTSPFTGREEITSEELLRQDPSGAKLFFKEAIFGPDPVKSLQTRIAESSVALETEGLKVPFTEKQVFTPEELKEKGAFGISKATALSGVAIGGLVGLDFTGWGGSKKQAAKALSKMSKIDDIVKGLKSLNVTDDLIDLYKGIIASTKNVDEVVKILDKITDVQKTTRATEEAIEQAAKASKTRKFLKSVEKARPDIKLDKVGGQYIPRSTDELAMKAKNLIDDNIEVAEQLARTGTDEKAVATASELIKYYGDEALEATKRGVQNAMWDKAGEIAHIAAANLTEQGRAVQAASIMGRLTPEGMLRFAAREINKYNEAIMKSKGVVKGKLLPQLTSAQTSAILREMKRIEAMADGTKKALAFNQLQDSIMAMIPSPMMHKLVAIWKAGLLTGIKTSGLNTVANLSHGVSETIKDIPASGIDSIARLFTGKKTLTFNVADTPKGIVEGFKKGWQYLRTGLDERNIGAKLDFKKVNFGDSKLAKSLQRYEETIFRILGAEDQPFFYGAKARSLADQAIAQAKNVGKKGKEATKFIDDLIKNPTDKMLRYALIDAEIAVFQNPTTLGKMLKSLQNLPVVGQFIAPFTRTIGAVANQLVNYSPVGIVKAIVQNIGRGKFDQRLFSQAMGRGITGSAIMYLGKKLGEKGLINTNYPTTERERELWQAEDRKPNTIKIGDKLRSVAVLGPAGFALLVGARYKEALDESGSVIEALSEASFSGIKSLGEQTFLQGLNQLTTALNNPKRSWNSVFANTAASVIPTLIGDIAKVFDPYERRSEGMIEKMEKRLPGFRQLLEPQIDILGRETPRGGNVFETLMDPSRPSKDINTLVTLELRRLMDAGYKISPTMLGDKGGYEALTPKENTTLWKKTGQLISAKLTGLFSLKGYEALSDMEKAKYIDDIIGEAKIVARTEMVMQLTEGLKGIALEKKLGQLKASGLMPLDVWKRFIEMQ